MFAPVQSRGSPLVSAKPFNRTNNVLFGHLFTGIERGMQRVSVIAGAKAFTFGANSAPGEAKCRRHPPADRLAEHTSVNVSAGSKRSRSTARRRHAARNAAPPPQHCGRLPYTASRVSHRATPDARPSPVAASSVVTARRSALAHPAGVRALSSGRNMAYRSLRLRLSYAARARSSCRRDAARRGLRIDRSHDQRP